MTRVEAAAAKRKHEDEVRAMSRLEDWAATRIQALVRGRFGRARARAEKLEHMGRWKEMYDEDRGANFYYNKVRADQQMEEQKDGVCHHKVLALSLPFVILRPRKVATGEYDLWLVFFSHREETERRQVGTSWRSLPHYKGSGGQHICYICWFFLFHRVSDVCRQLDGGDEWFRMGSTWL